jgi:hypothetical protein
MAACRLQFIYILESPRQPEIPDEDDQNKLTFFIRDGFKEANKCQTKE